jgi:hypothetical protein
VEVDPVLIVGVVVLEVVGDAGDGREFVAGRRIEVGVAAAAVDAAMADADIGEARGVVGADRNVAEPVDHEIVHAVIHAP